MFASYFVTNAQKLQYNSTICFWSKCKGRKSLALVVVILGQHAIEKYFVVTAKFRLKTVLVLKRIVPMMVHFCGPEIATFSGLSNAIRCPNVNMRYAKHLVARMSAKRVAKMTRIISRLTYEEPFGSLCNMHVFHDIPTAA